MDLFEPGPGSTGVTTLIPPDDMVIAKVVADNDLGF